MCFNGEAHRQSTAELIPNESIVAVTIPFPILSEIATELLLNLLVC